MIEAISESPNTSSIYPTLELGVLERLYEHIRDYFKESQVALEVITDPETEDQELVIFICTNLPPDEVYKKLEQLDEEWWLDAPVSVREKLCIEGGV
ncbi:MAG: hypothetical protein ACXQTS_01320 [Candidatus Methanospirareceae archaeon]